MATTYTVFEPQWIAPSGVLGPKVQQILPLTQTGLFRGGDILINQTAGTITAPSPNGTFAVAGSLTPGPSLGTNPSPFNVNSSSYSVVQGVVTVAATASAGTPAQTYFCVLTYAGGGAIETLPGTYFTVNVAAGLLPTFLVSSTGAPTNATGSFLYASTIPNTYWRQDVQQVFASTHTVTYPLANRIGANKAAAAVSTGILGMADSDSDAIYGGAPGGSVNTGKQNIFGASQSFSPGWTNDPYYVPVIKGDTGLFELNLVQTWYGTLLYAAVGLNIDATTGYFVADTTQTACATIQNKTFGPGRGDVGDTYARVQIRFNAAALA